MLKKISESLPAIFLAIVFGGLLLGPLSSRAEVVDRIVAIVNDDIILLSEMEQAVQVYQQMLNESGYSNGRQRLSRDQQSQLLEKMIHDKLIDQEAKRLGITIGAEEVDRTIERIQQINKVSREEMLQMFKLKGMNEEEYRSQIKEQLLQSRIVNREVKSKVVITEEDLKKYYQDKKNQYAGQTKFHLKHILMQVRSQTPDEREQVYGQMQQIRVRLKDGEDFAALAKAHSHAATAEQGGDLGFFESRLLAENIRQALEGLKTGDITEVVETEQGYQLFYVEDVVHAGGKSFEDAKDEIHEKLLAEVTERKFDDWFKAMRQKAHIQLLD